jgi:hypothetical protein
VIEPCQNKFYDYINEDWDEGEMSTGTYKVKDDIIAEDVKVYIVARNSSNALANAVIVDPLGKTGQL